MEPSTSVDVIVRTFAVPSDKVDIPAASIVTSEPPSISTMYVGPEPPMVKP